MLLRQSERIEGGEERVRIARETQSTREDKSPV
jgi:hypothetical protein